MSASLSEETKVRNRIKTVSTMRVAFLGGALIAFGMLGFQYLPGLIAENASGSKIVNSFYCSVITLTTIGFGDICPANPDFVGRVFLTVFPLCGLGFFCGPILELASSWRTQVPGGPLSVAIFTLMLGASIMIQLEGLSPTDAIHFCIVLGTTIGYGDITPSSDAGRMVVAIYAVLALNVVAGILDVGREQLEAFCHMTTPKAALTTTKEPIKNLTNENKKSKESKKNS